MLDFLDDKQKKAFAATNALVGLGPQEYTAELTPEQEASLPNHRIMSNDPAKSNYPTYLVPVSSIQDLRRIGGFPPMEKVPKNYQAPGEEPDYPPPPNSDDTKYFPDDNKNNKPLVSEELRKRIQKAAEAFVLGNPHRVKEYIPLINALIFPGEVAVFTGKELNVPAGTTLAITSADPVFLNYGKITVGKGATISVQSTHTITTQIFIQS